MNIGRERRTGDCNIRNRLAISAFADVYQSDEEDSAEDLHDSHNRSTTARLVHSHRFAGVTNYPVSLLFHRHPRAVNGRDKANMEGALF